MLTRSHPVKSLLRNFGIELKRSAFGLDLREDLKLFYAQCPPVVVFDIGANHGQSALGLHDLFPAARIFSFEPASRTFGQLRKNVGHVPLITPIQAALGGSEGSALLKITGASVNTSILDYSKPGGLDRICEQEEVPVRTVAGVCEERSLDHIDFMKVDTQGFDLEVLRGAERLFAGHRIRGVLTEVILVELYENQARFHDICAYMAGMGLQFCGLYGVHRESDLFIHWADALFIDPAFKKGCSTEPSNQP